MPEKGKHEVELVAKQINPQPEPGRPTERLAKRKFTAKYTLRPYDEARSPFLKHFLARCTVTLLSRDDSQHLAVHQNAQVPQVSAAG